ncbi:MAG TPA: LOG family protein [Phycisphaerae bacterium]|nr:LOG family protein [Phycisphaerae bacterium]HRW54092.1 LOG family protein [Phycisphaerae bacterium]
MSKPLTEEQRAAREGAIDQFVSQFASGRDADMYASMLRTICRMSRDDTSRGDVKIVERALAELRYAFKTFAPYENTPKVSIFGSSRTPEDHPDYIQAVRFAEQMRMLNWMVITGAGDGIMKAGHGGAGKEASFGVAIRLPFEQKTNDIIEGDQKLVNFKYFFTRKLMFTKEAQAVALFPGGFGTQDEGFEVLTLVQTGKAEMVPIVLLDAPGGTYWQHWRTYVKAELLHNGMISSEDMNLFKVTDSVDEAVEEITTFYRRFHSSRYVHDHLILRLNSAAPEGSMDYINEKFSDILSSGTIEAIPGPLGEERDEFPDKPRLRLHFNRRSHGRLRLMLDYLNKVDMPAAAKA